MRHLSLLAIRNWQARKARTLGAIAAIALGTGVVVWVTCSYESVTQAITRWAAGYVGEAHITVSSPFGRHDAIPQRIVPLIAELSEVRETVPLLVQRRRFEPWPRADVEAQNPPPATWNSQSPEADLTGIDLQRELLVRKWPIVAGRMLQDDDVGRCVVDAKYAAEEGLTPGDFLLIWAGADATPHRFEIVGLLERKRVVRYQKPVVLVPLREMQEVASKIGFVTSVDVILRDNRPELLSSVSSAIRTKIRAAAPNAVIRTAAARLKQIEQAQAQQNFVMVLLAAIAMLTSLFIILSTLSMGMVERIRLLGLIRCIGATRGQLARLILAEVVPIGVVGVGVGVPIGLVLAVITVWLVPEYVGSFALSWRGIWLAVSAGGITTLVAGLLPAIAALRVTPLEAAHPRARPTSTLWVLAAAGLALALLAFQHFGMMARLERSVWFLQAASAALIVLYFGYALLGPLLVRLVGAPAVQVAALALGLRARLLHDQVGQAVWRSAGICCGLMVGLSLIVGLVVVNESVRRGWQFPTQFPGAYVWSNDQLPPDTPKRVRDVAGIDNFTVVNAINVGVDERGLFSSLMASITWFFGCEPEEFLEQVNVQFSEGDKESAKRLLAQGGHVLIADDFARSRNKKLGDEITVYHQSRAHKFKVAGVILSPAIDIAAGYFQLHSEYTVIASGSVLGSNADMRAKFGLRGYRALLINLSPITTAPPPNWPPPRGPQTVSFSDYVYSDALPLQRRWERHQGDETLREVLARINSPYANYGTIRDLKDEIDASLGNMMVLLTAVPGVALIVAAVGVANLMTANVAARSKQIAILRAVGATRGQILRLVVGEALVLGLVGVILGLGLGLHLAANIAEMIGRMWGFMITVHLPWGFLSLAIALTLTLCLIAAILPARHASRTNVVDALHVA